MVLSTSKKVRESRVKLQKRKYCLIQAHSSSLTYCNSF
jgi:hypothetical protein